MNIDLSKYALERHREQERKVASPGPVVTISRQYGCPSKIYAQMLIDAINAYQKEKPGRKEWSFVNKELLEQSASELQLHPSMIKYVFNYEEKSIFDEILAAQSSRYYMSDKKIRKTIGEVIRSIAIEGNVIIVGRAGVAMTRNIKRSLHVKLMAPLAWRVEGICRIENLTKDKAIKLANETDKKRKQFIDYYYGKPSDDTLFDILINCATMTREEVVQTIVEMMKIKKLI
jgi:cytidylate kinase